MNSQQWGSEFSVPSESVEEHGIETPEQVELRFPLAGLGSRFLANALDLVILLMVNFVFVIVVLVVLGAVSKTGALNHMSSTATKWFVAFVILFYFVQYWGYFALFEAFRNGQTPGKSALKIRVIKDSGRQITFFEALARNLLRVVDYFPGMYLVGVISILATKQNKRLGDLVADTIVVHERAEEFTGYLALPVSRTFTSSLYAAPVVPAPVASGIAADRMARLSADDLHVIDSFLARALALPTERRAMLGSRLLDGLCAKMGVPVPIEVPPERTLEAISYALRGQDIR
ncbi:putative membrane protein/domain protein [Terriglobus roseus DSM 18391]|uniref:Putative membrane protein/domain protein n=1 Tax=Terriglobus roseus (strain DSM 18391 / NRRL B-41598 / KBS 63) TaxID=926566 RepID=I3ZDL2_TERRK|nr:RDD family protein [Terriglobus roseus]AFL87330.1 putative membrane protein/domain protein [Terriglobus roseus DSM 18391]